MQNVNVKRLTLIHPACSICDCCWVFPDHYCTAKYPLALLAHIYYWLEPANAIPTVVFESVEINSSWRKFLFACKTIKYFCPLSFDCKTPKEVAIMRPSSFPSPGLCCHRHQFVASVLPGPPTQRSEAGSHQGVCGLWERDRKGKTHMSARFL